MLDFNTIVVGAGPAGMGAALYLKRAGIDVLLIDKDAPGGQMLKTSKVENYLGFESINGADLALKMFEHVKNNDIPFEFGEVVLVSKGENYSVELADKKFTCKHVIIATGRIPNKLNLPGEDRIQGISYCAVCDGTFYRDKVVGVVGGGNSAFTNALYLADLCQKVYIFVRGNVSANAELVNRTKNRENIIVLKDTSINELLEKDNHLTGVVLQNDKIVDLNGLFVAIGGKPKVDFINNISLEREYITVNEHMESSLKGLYACGDVIYKEFYQIATAINDGVVAALSIKAGEWYETN